MSIIWGAIEAIIIFAALLFAYHLFDDVEDDELEARAGIGTNEYVTAGGVAVMVGVINAFAPLLQEGSLKVAPFMLIAMIAVYVYLAYLWHDKGSELKEMIPFIFLLIPITLTTMQVAWSVTALIQSDLLASIVQTIPMWLAILTLGFMVFDFYHFRYSEVALFDTGKGTKANAEQYHSRGKYKLGMIATAVVVALMLLGSCVSGMDLSKANNAEVQLADGVYAASGDEIGSVTLDVHDGVHFYHFDVLNDGNDDNDWNNGPAVKSNYKSTLKKRIKKDPALLAQLMMAYDYTVNTDFIGETIYVDYDDKWTVLDRTDAACRIMASNASIHNNGYKAITKMIDGADKITHEKRQVSDQVFMHANTIDGVPSTVVFTSNVKTAWCTVLHYSFKDSDEVAEIVLRDACGFQWANGASYIGVTPASYPTGGVGSSSHSKASKPSGKGDNSRATWPSKKPKPGPSPTPTPSYNKDPNKAPSKDTEPNDDPGPGPNTNNPSDPNHSTEDKPSNSDHMTYDDYKDRVKQNEDANKPSSSSSGGSSSGGSSSGGSTHRDDNSSSGTGNGGINKPTPSSKPASSGGKPVTDSGAGDKWDGPSD